MKNDVVAEKVTTTVVERTTEEEVETDILIKVGQDEVYLSHLNMAKWLARKCGGVDEALAAVAFLKKHGTVVAK